MHQIPNIFDYDTFVQNWWSNAFLSMGTALCGSVILIWLYDSVKDAADYKEKEMKRKIAFNSLYRLLDNYYRNILYGMYRSATLTEKEFSSLNYLVSDEYFEEIKYLDLNKSPYLARDDSKQNDIEDCRFIPRNYQIIFDYNKELTKYLLDEVLMVYGQFLASDVCEVLQEFRFSSFVLFSNELPSLTKRFNQFKALRASSASVGGFAPNGFNMEINNKLIDTWRKHNEMFIKIVSLHNQYAPENKVDLIHLSNQVTLEWGCCRIGNFSGIPITGETDIDKIFEKFKSI